MGAPLPYGVSKEKESILDRGVVPHMGIPRRSKSAKVVLIFIYKLTFKRFSDASVKRTARLAQQCAVSSVLNQGMFEQVRRVRRDALPKYQSGRYETIERREDFPFRFADHRSQQRVRKLVPYGRADLCHLFCWNAYFRDAAAVASKLARFRHPMLATVKVSGDVNDPLRIRDDITADELRAEIITGLERLGLFSTAPAAAEVEPQGIENRDVPAMNGGEPEPEQEN
jgi:hypothetical protein